MFFTARPFRWIRYKQLKGKNSTIIKKKDAIDENEILLLAKPFFFALLYDFNSKYNSIKRTKSRLIKKFQFDLISSWNTFLALCFAFPVCKNGDAKSSIKAWISSRKVQMLPNVEKTYFLIFGVFLNFCKNIAKKVFRKSKFFFLIWNSYETILW